MLTSTVKTAHRFLVIATTFGYRLGFRLHRRNSNVRSLVKFGKENPNRLQIGINQGAATHLFAAAFARAAGIEVMLIPYKGGGERVVALAGGHIDADFGVFSQYRSMMHANKLRILGVAATSRLPSNKDVPTFIEWHQSEADQLGAP